MFRFTQALMILVLLASAALLLYFVWPRNTADNMHFSGSAGELSGSGSLPPLKLALVLPPLKSGALPPAALPHRLRLPTHARDERAALTPGVLPRIAIVIDDCGLSDSGTREAINLPAAITLSFLPYGHRSTALARQAREAGHDVMLHMPMQPVGRDNPGPNALTVDLGEAAIAKRVDEAFRRVPDAVGLNNHMGSRFTAWAEGLTPVMRAIAARELFFLDSVTSPKTVGVSAARAAGVPVLARDVFLDDRVTETEVRKQLDHAEKIALARGSVIAIGHPHPSTLRVLRAWADDLEQRGFQLVPVRHLLP